MFIDLECIAHDLVEVSAKKALDEMPADKRAAFEASIAAKVDEYVAGLTAKDVGSMIGGNIIAVAVGNLRHIIDKQIESGKGVIVEAMQAGIEGVFTVANVKAVVQRTIEAKPSPCCRNRPTPSSPAP